MRRLFIALIALMVLIAGLTVEQSAAAATGLPAHSTRLGHALRPGQVLRAGQRLVSANGRFRAVLVRSGRLAVERSDGTVLWRTSPRGGHARLTVRHNGQLLIANAARTLWRSNTAHSGRADVLSIRNNGVLTLTSHHALVWSSQIGTDCATRQGKSVLVRIGAQAAHFCRSGQQLRATRVTTGAVNKGDATPTGTWRVQSKQTDRYLYPAAGGAYYVHFWMPYDGAYGFHDAPWQKFAYGSSRYRSRGSHGCVHVPGATMAWLFHWARIGTVVRITA